MSISILTHFFSGTHCFDSCLPVTVAVIRMTFAIRMHNMFGWRPSCEYPDLLHCLWLGTGRDATASHVLELAKHWRPLQQYDTWDQRLRVIHQDFQCWCSKHGLRASVIDEISRMLTLNMYCFDDFAGYTLRCNWSCSLAACYSCAFEAFRSCLSKQ